MSKAGTGTTIDDALTLLRRYGPEFGEMRLANHGPMASEALLTLNRAPEMMPWAESYTPRLEERPRSSNPINAEAWREALGQGNRVADWTAFFEAELARESYQTALKSWIPRLLPGLAAAAAHGVIRVAHAVRSLDAGVSAPRTQELADGFGYWAASYFELPGTPSDRVRAPSAALAEIPRVELSNRDGSITARLKELGSHPRFHSGLEAAGPGDDASAFLSDLTATMAHVYLANAAHGSAYDIALIHALTGPSAVRLLAPHLDAATTQVALRYAWQVAAGIYAAYSDTPYEADASSASAPHREIDDIIDRAVATGDEHAIKFTEACLREHAIAPDPALLAAADLVADRLAPN
jgi:hypothetical protein